MPYYHFVNFKWQLESKCFNNIRFNWEWMQNIAAVLFFACKSFAFTPWEWVFCLSRRYVLLFFFRSLCGRHNAKIKRNEDDRREWSDWRNVREREDAHTRYIRGIRFFSVVVWVYQRISSEFIINHVVRYVSIKINTTLIWFIDLPFTGLPTIWLATKSLWHFRLHFAVHIFFFKPSSHLQANLKKTIQTKKNVPAGLCFFCAPPSARRPFNFVFFFLNTHAHINLHSIWVKRSFIWLMSSSTKIASELNVMIIAHFIFSIWLY